MIVERAKVELGDAVLRMFRAGADTLEIADRLRIFKRDGRPNEAKVCGLLYEARRREKLVQSDVLESEQSPDRSSKLKRHVDFSTVKPARRQLEAPNVRRVGRKRPQIAPGP